MRLRRLVPLMLSSDFTGAIRHGSEQHDDGKPARAQRGFFVGDLGERHARHLPANGGWRDDVGGRACCRCRSTRLPRRASLQRGRSVSAGRRAWAISRAFIRLQMGAKLGPCNSPMPSQRASSIAWRSGTARAASLVGDPVDGEFELITTEDGEHWHGLPEAVGPRSLAQEGAFAREWHVPGYAGRGQRVVRHGRICSARCFAQVTAGPRGRPPTFPW